MPPNDWVVQIDGGCTNCTVSWATYVLDLGTLGAGSHTVTIGAYNNRKTTETESGQVAIDDVQIAGPAPGVALTSPTDGDVVAGLVTIGVGADDLEDAAGTLDVDVRINGGGWQQAFWDAGLGVYTLIWDTTALPEGPATVEARAVDGDGNASATPMANVTVNNENAAPTATITNPSNGATVGGSVTVRVQATDAEDAPGTLDVEVNTGQGWKSTSWNAGNQRYEYVWDTTQQSNGAKTIQARATDSNAAQTNATSIGVTVDNNVDAPPTVDLVTPAPNTVISGDYSIRIAAGDAEDADETLTVEVDYGTGWMPATWNSWTGLFHTKILSIDEGLPDGPFVMKVRATDSANQTTQAADVPMNISNSAYAQSVFDDKPVMYWRFNEKSGDMAGDSRKANDNGVYNGVNPNSGTLLSDGEPGTAARFDGNNDWVWLPNRAALNTGGPYERRTIELWFRADDTNERQVLWQEGGAGRGFNIYLAGDRLYAGVWNQVNDDETTPFPPSFVSYDGIVAGETYFVALTFTSVGDKLRLFVNGDLVDSDGGVGRVFAHVARSSIGGVDQGTRFHDGTSNWSGYYFDGKIDEVAVYNRTLGLADIVERWEIGSGIG